MSKILSGAGLGFRRALISEMDKADLSAIDFFELAPENWIQSGGKYHRDLKRYTEKHAFAAHGLSLSIGSTEKLDTDLLVSIKEFLDEHQVALYTEHLSWCSDDGHLYDLLPIPCTEDAVKWVSSRIKIAQDILGRQIGFENASYYFTPPGAEMREEEFVSAVVSEADCLLHLDVNNIYVNSQNHNFDALQYLAGLPLDKVCYMHVAGHHVEDDGIIVDTHGAQVIDPVWQLLADAYQRIPMLASSIPTCLERDFNFPDLAELVSEVEHIRSIQLAANAKASELSA
jgi:uncharacterized protein (UPF0276 family)